jgi:hypothetical protein
MTLPHLNTKFTSNEREALELSELMLSFCAKATMYHPESLKLAAEYLAYHLKRDDDYEVQAFGEEVVKFLRSLQEDV